MAIRTAADSGGGRMACPGPGAPVPGLPARPRRIDAPFAETPPAAAPRIRFVTQMWQTDIFDA